MLMFPHYLELFFLMVCHSTVVCPILPMYSAAYVDLSSNTKPINLYNFNHGKIVLCIKMKEFYLGPIVIMKLFQFQKYLSTFL